MKIEYFRKKTNQLIPDTDNELFVMNNEVYSDNFDSYESQSAVVGFEDFIIRLPDVGWRVVST